MTIDSGQWTIKESLRDDKNMDNVIEQKSFRFAVRMVKLCRFLQEDKKEYTLSKQLLRAGTSIGANIVESQQAQSRADFIAKLNIALKEAAETDYWLRLLQATDYLTKAEFSSLITDCREIEKLLTAIIKTSRNTTITTP